MKKHVIKWMNADDTERLLRELGMGSGADRQKAASVESEAPQVRVTARAEIIDVAKLEVENL